MNKALIVYALVCGMALIACKKEDGDTYAPPQPNTGTGGSTTISSSGNTINYSDLCEQSGGDLVAVLCCDHNHPFKVDTCKGEAKCPMGGETCENVIVCECRENMCFSMDNGCQSL
jgi:hypothetical protein